MRKTTEEDLESGLEGIEGGGLPGVQQYISPIRDGD